MAIALEALNSDKKRFLVQNAGVNGNTTRQALERLQYDVTSHTPDYVLIQFGMNDCNYWETDRGLPRVSPAAFMANLEEIVRKCLGAGAKHCFINTNHLSSKGPFRHIVHKTYDQSNSEYNTFIRNVVGVMCEERIPVSLFDIEHLWQRHLVANPTITLRDLLHEDGIHLSDDGHQLYAKSLVPRTVEKIRTIEGL